MSMSSSITHWLCPFEETGTWQLCFLLSFRRTSTSSDPVYKSLLSTFLLVFYLSASFFLVLCSLFSTPFSACIIDGGNNNSNKNGVVGIKTVQEPHVLCETGSLEKENEDIQWLERGGMEIKTRGIQSSHQQLERIG